MRGTDLTDRVAIVTGASRGIGLATAEALHEAGAHVVLTSRSQESADEAAASVGERAVGIAAHAADDDASRACVAQVMERFGRIDVLVNNAGTNPAYGPLMGQDHARVAKTMDVNLWAPLRWTQLVVEAWMGEHGGSVVNNASLGAYAVDPDLAVYHASKAALVHLTRHLTVELGPGVRVNAVAPGVVRTRLAEALWRDHEAAVAGRTPLGRIGEPNDVASAILFLASDAAAWITGETLVIDGGQLIGRQSGEDS
ncbi:SDR family oxidoreductase [Nocardioidaceae bacterium]|nr:SDR family oxidoreductase [Nocardioidaceae bacterium]